MHCAIGEEFHYRLLTLLRPDWWTPTAVVCTDRSVWNSERWTRQTNVSVGAIKKENAKGKENKLNVWGQVRIIKYKMTFPKDYTEKWDSHCALHATDLARYVLKEQTGGAEGEHKLCKTSVGDVYLVEKILRSKRHLFWLRWLGFDGTHDSWIKKKDLIEYELVCTIIFSTQPNVVLKRYTMF